MTWFGLMQLILFDLICLDAQLGTYQPPIPKTYQASAWSYLYIGRWMCKTGGSPIWLGKKFVRLNGWKIPRQKWLISYLWEHVLVPEHQIPIWLYLTHQNQWNSIGFINMLIHQLSLSSRNHWNSCGVIDMLIHGLSMGSRNHWYSLGFINILHFEDNGRWARPLPGTEDISPKSA